MANTEDDNDDESTFVTEEDLEFVRSIGSRNAFLTDMDLPAPKQWLNPRKAKRKRAKEMQQIARDEQDYEHKPRVQSEKRAKTEQPGSAAPQSQFGGGESDGDAKKDGGRLPIKVGKRLVHAPQRSIAIPEEASARAQNTPAEPQTDHNDSPDSAQAVSDAKTTRETSVKKKTAAPQQGKLLMDYKLELAGLSAAILAAPEESTSKLRELRELCSCNDANPITAASVTKLAIMSLATVFKDIIPGYRIRDITEKEKAAKVSKEVQKEREYDESLLRNYQMYLKRLHALVKTGGAKSNMNNKRAVGLMTVSIRAMCM